MMYEPAHPRPAVMTRTPPRWGFGRAASGGWCGDAEEARADSARVVARAYGLEASARACALTMRAPPSSSGAEKIFFVDRVERIRRRSARSVPAMGQAFLLTWT